HDKIREVAYLALGPARRRSHHLRVARSLERVHERDLASVSGHIAWHYERAGAAGLAIDWYERAAELAQQSFGNAEATRLLDRALELVRAMPDTTERRARELSILTELSTSVGWV